MKKVKQQITWLTFIVSEMLSDRLNVVLSADVRVFPGVPALHPRQLAVLRAAPRMDGCAGGWRRGGGGASAGHKKVQKNNSTRVFRGLSCIILTEPPFLQNDRPSAQRERPAAALRVGCAAHDPRQRPGEQDDQLQFVSVHLAQHALASWTAIEPRVREGETGKGETTAALMNFTFVQVESDF